MDNMVKDPNRKEKNKQWLLYKGGREFEFGTTQIQLAFKAGLERGAPNYKSSALTAQPRYLRCKRYYICQDHRWMNEVRKFDCCMKTF